MEYYNILGILVKEPEKGGKNLQQLLIDYGCVIRNRLGIHRESVIGGIIVLDIFGDEEQIRLFFNDLEKIDGIEYQYVKI